MYSLKAAADVENPHSLSNRMRNKRFTLFDAFIRELPKPLRLIDIGGTEMFWERRGWAGRTDIDITAINRESSVPRYSNLRTLSGDATDLSDYGNKEFDVAFSNSVIEHLFTRENQARMAAEVDRIAKAYWVQTPDFWFPIEPHFHVPGWQWLPRNTRVALIQRRRCGWRGPCPDLELARAAVDEVRLMTVSEMRNLFSGGEIWQERFCGLSKSIVAYSGFGRTIEDVRPTSNV